VSEGPARDECAQHEPRQRPHEAATQDRSHAGGARLAGSGQGGNTHESGV
jgi:hypothetical protein